MKTEHFNKLFLFLTFACMIGLFSVSKVMAANLLEPQVAIEKTSIELKARLKNQDFAKDFSQVTEFVKQTINPYMDFNRISALVLGKLWRKATKEEKIRFRQEFKTLLIRTYSRAFVELKEWSINFLPLKITPKTKKVIVKTQILQPGIRPLAINYRMLLTRGQWKVYDIIIAGVSLVTNYRSSFKNEVRRSGSLTAMIDRLAARNAAALVVKNR